MLWRWNRYLFAISVFVSVAHLCVSILRISFACLLCWSLVRISLECCAQRKSTISIYIEAHERGLNPLTEGVRSLQETVNHT